MRINVDTFGAQMAAAGLAGLPVQWTADGLNYFGEVSDADRAKVEAVLAAHDPTALPPAPPRQQLGTVFLGAVVDLGWWGWMDQGAAAQAAVGKPLDQRYWQAIGKADIVLATDAKLIRVARAAEMARVTASGQPAPPAPVITMAAIFDHGAAMTAPAAATP